MVQMTKASRKGLIVTCSLCHKEGHNKTTCHEKLKKQAGESFGNEVPIDPNEQPVGSLNVEQAEESFEELFENEVLIDPNEHLVGASNVENSTLVSQSDITSNSNVGGSTQHSTSEPPNTLQQLLFLQDQENNRIPRKSLPLFLQL